MSSLQVTAILYGPLAEYLEQSNRVGAETTLTLPEGSTMRDLLNRLGLPNEKRSYTFLNGNLTSMPGLYPDLDLQLPDGGRVAFFHEKSMWPCQYRMNAPYDETLEKAMAARRDGGIRQRFDT